MFLLRAGAPEAVAGTYASVTVLVKAGFLLPATLSLYLLPRFVRNRDNRSLIRLGVFATLGVSVATGVVMVVFFALFGDWVIATLYGTAYQGGAPLLVPVSLAYVPWIAAQGLLIRVTSFASKAGALVLVLAVAAQWIAFTSVIPDIHAMLWSFGIIGMVVLGAFLVIDRLQWRPARVTRRTAR